MPYFLGIDGGGTKTEALVCDHFGNILGCGLSGASNPIFAGYDNALEAVLKAVKAASISMPEGENFELAAVCVPGMRKYEKEIQTAFKAFSREILVTGDELNAYYGAVAKPYGIVVVSGTGSFAMGFNRIGETCEIGGWGPLLGDEGSGYHIGIRCIKAAINEYEGVGPKTLLTGMVKKEYNINSINELKRVFYNEGFNRQRSASLSLCVKKAAEKGDIAAAEIIDDAAKNLALLVDKVVKKLNLYDGCYDAVLTGGVRKFGQQMTQKFQDYVQNANRHIYVRKPVTRPAVGSLLLALSKCGIDIEDPEILKNLKQSDNGAENYVD